MIEYNFPDERGHFGVYGGRFVSETLIYALEELTLAYKKSKNNNIFQREFNNELKNYVGRPTPIYFAQRLSEELGGAKIYLKREDLNHTGAHKINNVIGQAILAKSMGKTRIIAETGAGQHGVATATICAKYGLECIIYMGAKDIERQMTNVYRMNLLGAKVISVNSGSQTLKDALNEAMRDWVTNVDNTFYIIGTAAGPAPYPEMVRNFQSVIGKESLIQMSEYLGENQQPDVVLACVGGGSNALGIFYPFISYENVKLIGIEAAGEGINTNYHSSTLQKGSTGVLHGNRTFILQTQDGQITPTHSISAGLDYPGVGPEHSFLQEIGRAKYIGITDNEAVEAFHKLCLTEGIIPALESSHAIAYAIKLAQEMEKNQSILVCLSGRGDKDIDTIRQLKKEKENLK